MKFIDTHCHLADEDIYKEKEEIIKESLANEVEKIFTISEARENIEKNILIAEEFEPVFFSIGLHPHFANLEKKDDLEFVSIIFKQYKNHKKNIGFGEIGLDYYYGAENKKAQIFFLEQQLSLLTDYNKPIIIHSRNSDDDIYNILKELKTENPIIMHCYTGDKKFAKQLLDKINVYFSFNGIITFKKSINVQEVFLYLPLDKIILETDAPYLTPEPYRGKKNKPAYIKYTYEKCALLKNISLENFSELIYNNIENIFKI
ncbi:MAG TPA: TatD family hydrolase [bacterium]|nr:TatD family hydrolase [bacterium]HOL47607.1 TatD family hydrolase [bacterium]HPQ19407.1 TatD family hydrolase [bacterium]